jgi:hypothetical protein
MGGRVASMVGRSVSSWAWDDVWGKLGGVCCATQYAWDCGGSGMVKPGDGVKKSKR